MNIILSTAANPIHSGHLFMIHKTLSLYPHDKIYIDIAKNIDKNIKDSDLIERQNNVKDLGLDIMSINSKSFVGKSNLLKNSCFIIGTDTAIRICDKKYYADSYEHMFYCLRRIANNNCYFIVFPRQNYNFNPPFGFEFLFKIMEDKPPNISSTEIRENNNSVTPWMFNIFNFRAIKEYTNNLSRIGKYYE